MRYVLIFALILPAACSVLPFGKETAETVHPVGPDPAVAEVPDLSDMVPDETDMRPADTGGGAQRTIAGLGDPGRPGLWLETPLVSVKAPGKVRRVSGGGTVAVTLIPVAGEATAGSRLSLEAMRQLGAPLTELVEIEVTPGV